MEHTKLLSIVEDILNEGKTFESTQEVSERSTRKSEIKRCQVNCKIFYNLK